MSRQSSYGSASMQSEPQLIKITETTCFQLSLFKDIMKEYRRLDDSITMRLNRNNAQWRDKDRIAGTVTASSNSEACESFWRELVANWKGRKAVIDYCIGVVDNTTVESSRALDMHVDESAAGLQRSNITSNQVKRRQIQQELIVETIVRRRSWEAFTSRCKHFEPPMTDVEARRWWDAAVASRHVQ